MSQVLQSTPKRRKGADVALAPVVASHAIAVVDPVGARALNDALRMHVVPSTVSGYTSAFKKWEIFCQSRKIPTFPATEIWLCSYIIFASTSIKQDSMKWYLSAIHYFQALQGHPWEVYGSELVRRTLRTTKRQFGSSGKGLKMPLSCNTLAAMFAHIPNYPQFGAMTHDDRLFVTASVLAVSAFLRGGEFLEYSGNRRPTLRQRDVQVIASTPNSNRVQIAIARPKNMWWLAAANVSCGIATEGTGLPILPWVMLVLYRAFASKAGVCLTDNGPAFVMQDGSTLSRTWMVSKSQALLLQANISFVDQAGRTAPVQAASWRAGGVRSALDANVPVPVIMEMGRWRSMAWERYALITDTDKSKAMASMWSLPPVHPSRVGSTCPALAFAAHDLEE